MKRLNHLLTIALLLSGLSSLNAQTTTAPAEALSLQKTNTAIVPVQRAEDRSRTRTALVLQRAKENPGKCDIAFVGDSITQGWEGNGAKVWGKYYGKRKVLNLGVSGDRTQHVLWRFDQGQLDGIQPKVAVLLIGTNNSNRDDNTEAEILEGVTTVVREMQDRLPKTKILLVGIFPRGQTFSAQRGKILQVNQALAKLADDQQIFFIDFGSKLIENDGSISKSIMPDYLHLSPEGYELWASSMEPILKRLL